MGVRGLWRLLLPIGRRISIETLEGKTLAIDASIWLTQFLKAMRDKETGSVRPAAHLIGFFRRLAKLRFHGIRPVLVFDGPTPIIKLREIAARRRRREAFTSVGGGTDHVQRMAKRLLVQELKRRKARATQPNHVQSDGAYAPTFHLPEEDRVVDGIADKESAVPEERDKRNMVVPAVEIKVEETSEQIARELQEAEWTKGLSAHGGEDGSRPAENDWDRPLHETSSGNGADEDAVAKKMSFFNGDTSKIPNFFALDPHKRKDAIEAAKKQQRMQSRREFMPVAGQPTAYSQVQLRNFLKSSKLNLTIAKQAEELLQNNQEGEMMASDRRRRIILEKTSKTNDGSQRKVVRKRRRAVEDESDSELDDWFEDELETAVMGADHHAPRRKSARIRARKPVVVDDSESDESGGGGVLVVEPKSKKAKSADGGAGGGGFLRTTSKMRIEEQGTGSKLASGAAGAPSLILMASDDESNSDDGDGGGGFMKSNTASAQESKRQQEEQDAALARVLQESEHEATEAGAVQAPGYGRREDTDELYAETPQQELEDELVARAIQLSQQQQSQQKHRSKVERETATDVYMEPKIPGKAREAEHAALARVLRATEEASEAGAGKAQGYRNRVDINDETPQQELEGELIARAIKLSQQQLQHHPSQVERKTATDVDMERKMPGKPRAADYDDDDDDDDVDWEDAEQDDVIESIASVPTRATHPVASVAVRGLVKGEAVAESSVSLTKVPKEPSYDDFNANGSNDFVTAPAVDSNSMALQHAQATAANLTNWAGRAFRRAMATHREETGSTKSTPTKSAARAPMQPSSRRYPETLKSPPANSFKSLVEVVGDSDEDEVDWEEGETEDESNKQKDSALKTPPKSLPRTRKEDNDNSENWDVVKASGKQSEPLIFSNPDGHNASNDFDAVPAKDENDEALQHAQEMAERMANWAGRAFQRAMTAHKEETGASKSPNTSKSSRKKRDVMKPNEALPSKPTIPSSSPSPLQKSGSGAATSASFSDAEVLDLRHVGRKEVEERVAEDGSDTGTELAPQSDEKQEDNAPSIDMLMQQGELLDAEHRRQMRDGDTVTDEMKAEIIRLIQLFGIPYVEAPSEAEAQCAKLEELGLVDGIVTEDSDVFVFGGRNVFKNIFDDQKYVEVYKAEDAKRDLALERNDMVALAMLLGGDYTEGVRGVGIVNGMEVLQAFDMAEGTKEGLEAFRKWLDGFDPKEVLSDDHQQEQTPEQKFHRQHRTARTRWSAPANFPADNVLNAYLHPVVDNSRDPFSWGVPDTEGLLVFCAKNMGWQESETMGLLQPVLERLQQKTRQTRLDAYFMKYEDNIQFASVRSKRLQHVFQTIQGNGSADNSPHFKRKPPGGTKQTQTPGN